MPTSNFTGEKFLIILSKDGGEDSFHRFRPTSSTLLDQIGYPGYSGPNVNQRPTLGFSPAEVAANTGGAIGPDYNLHPSLNPLKAIYDAGEMAITHRVGPMFTNLNEYSTQEIRAATFRSYNGPIILPHGLGAHDQQQYTTVSMITRDYTDNLGAPRTMQESGFLGRLAERFIAFNPSLGSPAGPPATLGMQYGFGRFGNAANLIGRKGLLSPLRVPTAVGKFNRALETSTLQTAALVALDACMSIEEAEARQEYFRQKNLEMNTAIATIQPIVETAKNTTYTVDTSFADVTSLGGWQGLMRTIARMIEARATGVGLPRRTIFIANYASYDNHGAQGKTSGNLPSYFADEARALVDFRSAILALPSGAALWDNILILDHSEFARTVRENGSAGTDHAWARMCTAIGGAVNGGFYGDPVTDYGFTIYGTDGVPISGSGSHDVNGNYFGSGAMFPGISMEQYYDAALRWFGCDNDDIAVTLPRRSAFGAAIPYI